MSQSKDKLRKIVIIIVVLIFIIIWPITKGVGFVNDNFRYYPTPLAAVEHHTKYKNLVSSTTFYGENVALVISETGNGVLTYQTEKGWKVCPSKAINSKSIPLYKIYYSNLNNEYAVWIIYTGTKPVDLVAKPDDGTSSTFQDFSVSLQDALYVGCWFKTFAELPHDYTIHIEDSAITIP